MSTTDGALWPDEPVPAGVQPGPRADPDAVGEVALRAELDEANDQLAPDCSRTGQHPQALRALWRRNSGRRPEADTAAGFLPVIDNLDRAVAAARRSGLCGGR